MIFSEILSTCYYRLGYNTLSESETVLRMKSFTNDTVLEILTDPVIGPKLLRREMAITTIANSSVCALPQAATFIHAPIVDRTNQRKLWPVGVNWIRSVDPGRTAASTTPIAYGVRNYSSPIAAQPSAVGQMTVVSDNAASAETVYVEIVSSSGFTVVYNATLSGLTPVVIGANDTLQVNDVYLSGAAVGNVSLKDAAGNTLATIGIQSYRARYTLIELYPQPSSALTLYADVDLQLRRMTQDSDECLLPDEYSEAIVDGVRARDYDRREKTELADRARGLMGRRLSKFKLRIQAKEELNANQNPRFSQLGPYFPAGS